MNGFVLTDDFFLEALFQSNDLFVFVFFDFCRRNARPKLNDLGNIGNFYLNIDNFRFQLFELFLADNDVRFGLAMAS